ncbi:molybdenum cofactor guanylyltransferase [Paenibacillus sp.]|uniref:molybdenum cofactor guanylyltransferase n=1 Tax=Paenibacillus sp. TaxID=58172 RepID=UPI002D340CCA|nr:molybdenum cofactor guanylyltransferase [Paenibacillus sp.]HZG88227.1 molybdenum cofactor guanylyltransferase [Paenibacillus sp.]
MKRGVILLAGGENRRMGAEKWLLPLGGVPVLGRLASAFAGKADDLAVVLPYGADRALRARAEEAADGVQIRWLTDAEPSAGPLAGIEAAMSGSDCDCFLACAADMPFARWDIASLLFDICEKEGVQAAVPVRGGRLQPLFAVYRKDALTALQAYRTEGGRKVMGWIDRLQASIVPEDRFALLDPDERALFNMNTPEDYEKARRWIDS